MTKLKVLDLFSGIGGFSLGLERTGGFSTVAVCEIDEFCRRLLSRRFPNARQYDDVRTLTAERLAHDGIHRVNVITGGFPCQDVSNAGKRAGIEGSRSGLWSEIHRLAGELRPDYLVVENVAALLDRGMGRVLGDLAAIGFDAEWDCISAADIGLPQARDRVWIVAYPQGVHVEKPPMVAAQIIHGKSRGTWTYEGGPVSGGQADQPPLVGMVDGVPARLDGRDYGNRAASLGNSVVPQIPELIGHAILEAERAAA
ncbi:DNA (cytosine-5-)-methyltransferase [Rhizobium leguminosarum bv. viciae]|uniref:DNA cytosine methyltransferase n=1 Tax=Rhizobium TaxID=379 RepID=UPI001441CBF2|nr:DNA (cytosine-5-)-methyltransferase [Rhizobium leguminosarum]NKK06720.1 DNA (cytosine-5-)-methyltransferase [Rhizobium leguminosarum bv. viciae]